MNRNGWVLSKLRSELYLRSLLDADPNNSPTRPLIMKVASSVCAIYVTLTLYEAKMTKGWLEGELLELQDRPEISPPLGVQCHITCYETCNVYFCCI